MSADENAWMLSNLGQGLVVAQRSSAMSAVGAAVCDGCRSQHATRADMPTSLEHGSSDHG